MVGGSARHHHSLRHSPKRWCEPGLCDAQEQPTTGSSDGRFLERSSARHDFRQNDVQKYYANKKFIKNATSREELRKFESYVKYFQKYAAKYNFDYLMLAAQGYQESTLKQELVSPRGAVGVMQVLPQMRRPVPSTFPMSDRRSRTFTRAQRCWRRSRRRTSTIPPLLP